MKLKRKNSKEGQKRYIGEREKGEKDGRIKEEETGSACRKEAEEIWQ